MFGGVRMGQQSRALLLTLVMLISEACKPIRYGLDDPQQCKNIRVKWLKDDQCAIIVGKVTPPLSPRSVRSCQMVLGASSTSKLQYVQLTFDTFYINSCDVVLQISDSPSAQFDSKVRDLALLSCESPNPGKIYSHEGNHVKLFLKREDKYIRNYNFRINASLSAGPPVPRTSIKTIFIIVGLVTSVLIIGCALVYKYCTMRHSRWQESTHNLDTGEPCTPQVRHRFPRTNHPRNGQTVGTQTLMNVDLHNGQIHSSAQNNIPVDNEPHVHIIYGGQNGTVVLDTATDTDNIDLDCSPPSYEEAISMPSRPAPPGLFLFGSTTDASSAASTTTTADAMSTAASVASNTPTEVIPPGAVGGAPSKSGLGSTSGALDC